MLRIGLQLLSVDVHRLIEKQNPCCSLKAFKMIVINANQKFSPAIRRSKDELGTRDAQAAARAFR